MFKKTIGNHSYSFLHLKDLLAKASAEKSGDQLAGIAAQSMQERVAAQWVLAELPLKSFIDHTLLEDSEDEVSALISEQHSKKEFRNWSSKTIGELREILLRPETDNEAIKKIRPALTPEMISATAKIMRNQDLIRVAKKISNLSKFNNTQGLPGQLSTRLQPNHPTDDLMGIAASIIDGLLLGSGDAVIGVNPATDSPQRVFEILTLIEKFILEFSIPTQSCVLAHLTTQMEAIRLGAPLDLMFQSIGGTEKTNRAFGINLSLLDEAQQMTLDLRRGKIGSNVMYFETGQGSSLSSQTHQGIDQQTCEVRAYAVAKKFNPFLVNSVVGFIGPEYLRNGKQILRAGLEDHFAGKVIGLPMGVDICYTTHADSDDDDSDTLLTTLAAAGCGYIMGVPGADDIMLNYQSTSYQDAIFAREVLNLKKAPEFELWFNNFKQRQRLIQWHQKK